MYKKFSFLVFVLIDFAITLIDGRIGGYDLFASNIQLKILWENEIPFVRLLESIKENWKNGPKSIEM